MMNRVEKQAIGDLLTSASLAVLALQENQPALANQLRGAIAIVESLGERRNLQDTIEARKKAYQEVIERERQAAEIVREHLKGGK